MMNDFREGKSINQIVLDLVDECRTNNKTCIFSQLSHQLKSYEERRIFLKELGMSFYQEKIVFILDKFDKSKIPEYKLSFETAKEFGYHKLIDMVSATFDTTLDRKDKQDAILYGSKSLAEKTVNNSEDQIDGDRSWWQIGMQNGMPVGYVLPVKFEGCDRDGLIEGTLHHIGVLPEFRGNGFGTELLNRGCEVLNEIGMWRIFNDVDSENLPSLKMLRSSDHRETDKISKYQLEILS